MADRSSSKDRPSSGGASAGASGGAAPDGRTPGLRDQFARTRSALFGLIAAHIKLAKAEFAEIIDEIKRAAILGSIALGLVIVSSSFLLFSLILWLDDWAFGSIGWGALHGTALMVGVAVLLVLAIIDYGWRRASASFAIALGVALVVVGLLAADWTGLSHRSAGLPPGWLIAMVAGALVLGLLGAVLASPFGRSLALAGFLAGAVAGLLLGLLGSAGPGPRVAAAIGFATLLLLWPIVSAVMVFRHGIDMAKLKDRFVPDQTIETTKETIEWVREQMPHGPKS